MTLTETLEPLLLRRVYGTLPTGVAALAALVDGNPQGIAVSSFTSVSLDPPMVLVCVAHTSTTWPSLRHAPRLGISILAAGQEQACRQLSARDGDRFVCTPRPSPRPKGRPGNSGGETERPPLRDVRSVG